VGIPPLKFKVFFRHTPPALHHDKLEAFLALPRPPVAGPRFGHLKPVVQLHFHAFAVLRVRPLQVAPVVRVAASFPCAARGRVVPGLLLEGLRKPQVAVGNRDGRHVPAINIQRLEVGARRGERVNGGVVPTASSGVGGRSALEFVPCMRGVVAIPNKKSGERNRRKRQSQ